jgi:hypothetical protein
MIAALCAILIISFGIVVTAAQNPAYRLARHVIFGLWGIA